MRIFGGGTIQRNHAFATFDTSIGGEKIVLGVDLDMRSKHIYINNSIGGTYAHLAENNTHSLTLGTMANDKILTVDTRLATNC